MPVDKVNGHVVGSHLRRRLRSQIPEDAFLVAGAREYLATILVPGATQDRFLCQKTCLELRLANTGHIPNADLSVRDRKYVTNRGG